METTEFDPITYYLYLASNSEKLPNLLDNVSPWNFNSTIILNIEGLAL
jgi:hypothetical protein